MEGFCVYLHDMWARDLLDKDWQAGEEFSEEEHTHPDLVPFEQLPAEVGHLCMNVIACTRVCVCCVCVWVCMHLWVGGWVYRVLAGHAFYEVTAICMNLIKKIFGAAVYKLNEAILSCFAI